MVLFYIKTSDDNARLYDYMGSGKLPVEKFNKYMNKQIINSAVQYLHKYIIQKSSEFAFKYNNLNYYKISFNEFVFISSHIIIIIFSIIIML